MQQTIDKMYAYFVQYGLDVVAALLIFLIGKRVARFLSDLVEKAMRRASVDKTLCTFAKHMIFYTSMAFVVIASLNKLGVETSSFIAVVGAASLAVGLALQGSLANFASGVLIVLFQLIKVGDQVDIGGGGAVGIVADIQIFNTIIITSDKKRIIVPNSKVTGNNIIIEQS